MASSEQLKKFDENGFVVLENFLSEEEIKDLKNDCFNLVEEMDVTQHHTVFSTTKQTFRNDYFIKSSDKIGYFFEDGAMDDSGKLLVDKQKSINKIGHALHTDRVPFRKITHSDKIKNLCKSMDYKDPVIVQSMYIFKQPGIGGEVIPHQDASFLFCEKEQKVMGLWIALEDATLENGCLWFIPGSHKSGLYGNYRMIRNPDPNGDQSCIFSGEKPDYDKKKFVPCPVKKGDLIAIHGLVVHQSEKNLSNDSRHIYTFHMYDHAAGDWSEKNWLQPTEKGTFTHLYDFEV